MLQEKNIFFVGIDEWNRPCFKVVNENTYFGDTDHLFNYGASEKEVLEFYSDMDVNKYLLYFGDFFDCEPYGLEPDKMDIHLNLITREQLKKMN